MKDKLLVCTFSGGRTSAFMGQFLNNYDKYKDYMTYELQRDWSEK